MSLRNRKRREKRLLNSEFIAETAPRGLRHPLPPTQEVRVRHDYQSNPTDRQFRNVRRIDVGNAVQDLRRLHIQTDLSQNNIDPTGSRYYYERIKIGRDEQVNLHSSHPICREREERREVLFAKNKAGKGGQRPPRVPKLIIKCIRG